MDVVLDTNVVVSAIISPNGPPAEIIRAWRAGRITWITSTDLLDELHRTLRLSRLAPHLSWSADEIERFVALVATLLRMVEPSRTLAVVKADPDDDRVLEAAVEGHAAYVVSGDRHLLDLGEYDGIPIVTPARFLAILELG